MDGELLQSRNHEGKGTVRQFWPLNLYNDELEQCTKSALESLHDHRGSTQIVCDWIWKGSNEGGLEHFHYTGRTITTTLTTVGCVDLCSDFYEQESGFGEHRPDLLLFG